MRADRALLLALVLGAPLAGQAGAGGSPPGACGAAGTKGELEALVSRGGAGPVGGPASLDAERLARLEERFVRALAARREDSALRASLVGDGWEEVPGATEAVIVRPGDGLDGHGLFAVRPGTSTPILLSAPHALESDDRMSGLLALRLLEETRARAAAWSQVDRDRLDLAHEPATAFQAFHRAAARADPELLVVQLHGFAFEKRTSAAGRVAAAIVSDGTRSPAPWLRALVACLDRAPLGWIALYPDDVVELGGTTNAQGRALRELRAGRFVHLELSLDLRRRLLEVPSARAALGRCLEEVAR